MLLELPDRANLIRSSLTADIVKRRGRAAAIAWLN